MIFIRSYDIVIAFHVILIYYIKKCSDLYFSVTYNYSHSITYFVFKIKLFASLQMRFQNSYLSQSIKILGANKTGFNLIIFIFICIKLWVPNWLSFKRLVQNSSVHFFPPLILTYRRDNFVYHNIGVFIDIQISRQIDKKIERFF